jgi:ABC-2 type transport system permease protein
MQSWSYIFKSRLSRRSLYESIELVERIKEATPDSLQYVMFETITLYDNRIKRLLQKKLANGKYQVYWIWCSEIQQMIKESVF